MAALLRVQHFGLYDRMDILDDLEQQIDNMLARLAVSVVLSPESHEQSLACEDARLLVCGGASP